MNIKELIKSKTFWAGIIEIIGGISLMVANGNNIGGIEQISGGIITALGFTSICIRDAISKK